MKDIESLILSWKQEPGSTYNTWFHWEERLKNFRSIRSGLLKIIDEIESDKFGRAYRDSSLETVLHSITEQKQIFKGADHAFIWKPKLRIPDIYEDRENQIAFGRFLHSCFECCKHEKDLENHVLELSEKKIKGLGPALMNLLYFLHPTIVLPSNTAILKGYNLIFNTNIKLGSWNDYLTMRMNTQKFNEKNSKHFSNDLGAIAGFLFDMGKASATKENVITESEIKHSPTKKKVQADDLDHTNVQGFLRDIGLALGHKVWIASNDRNRPFNGGRLYEGCLEKLPDKLKINKHIDAISLIDVLWLEEDKIVAAFEVEHSTSIYSGLLRMLDLANSEIDDNLKGIFLVAPDKRELEVQAQMSRPSFQMIKNLHVRYLRYNALSSHKDSIIQFGESLKALEKISVLL
ncbi:MAG: type II restriction endonuclease [Bacteriovoracaceae bacterium]|nr:type II restriction endonuclease [Bacteriovoracaceae bacterium]